MRNFKQWFTAHPQSVGETYGEHMRFAAWFAFRLAQASGAALIHALIPSLFEKTASRILLDLTSSIERRH